MFKLSKQVKKRVYSELPGWRRDFERIEKIWRGVNEIPEKSFPKGSGIIPKHRVVQTQKDFISGEDTVMQFALELIRKSKP